MTKTTNEPNEIICECGHGVMHHHSGCEGIGCRCEYTIPEVFRNTITAQASRLSTLEAAVEERTETIKQLWKALDFLHSRPEYSVAHQNAAEVLAETAPKVQS